jgi:hypothetical protein
MTICYLAIGIILLHNLAVIANTISGAPEKNGNDVGYFAVETDYNPSYLQGKFIII